MRYRFRKNHPDDRKYIVFSENSVQFVEQQHVKTLLQQIHMKCVQTHYIYNVIVQHQNENFPLNSFRVSTITQAIHVIADPATSHQITPTTILELPTGMFITLLEHIVPGVEENPADIEQIRRDKAQKTPKRPWFPPEHV